MPPTPESCRPFLAAFDIQGLFVEQLGWDRHNERFTVTAREKEYDLRVVSKKSQFAIVVHEGEIPDKTTRTALDREIGKLFREHLTIIADEAGGVQWWRWVRRERNRPMVHREYVWRDDGSGEELLSRIPRIAFSIADEEDGRAHLVEVTGRSRDAFDADTITKKFYDRFKKEKDAFVKSIKGIPDVPGVPKDKKGADREWYGALMLNRLMLVYFIQKRGLLDRDTNYLRNRMSRVREILGKDRFHSFYRSFLLTLFHDGLSKKERTREIKRLIGDVPYLNGGVFEKHRLETPEVAIPDSAFEQVFEFFDAYRWCLDERDRPGDDAERDRKPEINPDVLGYIFEKYINQKEKGAYYTKEDITGYIARNTIIPFILDRVAETCKVAFGPKGTAWKLLAADPDRYLYPAMRHGVINADGAVVKLPKEVAAGIQDVTKRGSWNSAATAPYALPTETWREHIARRERCLEVRETLRSGSVTNANELVTLNLDIRQFAEDIIVGCEGPDSLRAIWREIEKITVLDPTCGSGAFLFAALEILQPLYQACLNRMQALIDDADATGHKAAMPKERETLARIAEHHKNTDYFILKSIIIKNLYGVDIMEEATEICRLRLFLKLVAQVDPSLPTTDIEPLPDIDFNIRPGNTLVGYVRLDDVKDLGGKLPFAERERARIDDLADRADRAYRAFRTQQMELGAPAADLARGKHDLKHRLEELDEELNSYLAGEYSITASGGSRLATWKTTHQPFHWAVDFYGIVRDGGFDVVIGNPPYVSAAKVRKLYSLRGFKTSSCPDIYAAVLERSLALTKTEGRCGMIVPVSLGFSSDFGAIRSLIDEAFGDNWFSTFARIPAALFSAEARVRNTIWIGGRRGHPRGGAWTTRFHRWFEEQRPHLFEMIRYAQFCREPWRGVVPKLNSTRMACSFERHLRSSSKSVADSLQKRSPHILYWKKTAYNWLNCCRTLPPSFDKDGNLLQDVNYGELHFADATSRDIAFVALNSKLQFLYWCMRGDDLNVPQWVFGDFPLDIAGLDAASASQLLELVPELERAMADAVSFKLNAGKRVGNYNLAKCRAVTDQSDAILRRVMRLVDAEDDIELLYTQMVRTSFDPEDADDAAD